MRKIKNIGSKEIVRNVTGSLEIAGTRRKPQNLNLPQGDTAMSSEEHPPLEFDPTDYTGAGKRGIPLPPDVNIPRDRGRQAPREGEKIPPKPKRTTPVTPPRSVWGVPVATPPVNLVRGEITPVMSGSSPQAYDPTDYTRIIEPTPQPRPGPPTGVLVPPEGFKYEPPKLGGEIDWGRPKVIEIPPKKPGAPETPPTIAETPPVTPPVTPPAGNEPPTITYSSSKPTITKSQSPEGAARRAWREPVTLLPGESEWVRFDKGFGSFVRREVPLLWSEEKKSWYERGPGEMKEYTAWLNKGQKGPAPKFKRWGITG